jgi:hypothetical protein
VYARHCAARARVAASDDGSRSTDDQMGSARATLRNVACGSPSIHASSSPAWSDFASGMRSASGRARSSSSPRSAAAASAARTAASAQPRPSSHSPTQCQKIASPPAMRSASMGSPPGAVLHASAASASSTCGCMRAFARPRPGPPVSSPSTSASSAIQRAWRARVAASSPASRSRASPYSRSVSSRWKRGSPSS